MDYLFFLPPPPSSLETIRPEDSAQNFCDRRWEKELLPVCPFRFSGPQHRRSSYRRNCRSTPQDHPERLGKTGCVYRRRETSLQPRYRATVAQRVSRKGVGINSDSRLSVDDELLLRPLDKPGPITGSGDFSISDCNNKQRNRSFSIVRSPYSILIVWNITKQIK